MIQRIAVKIQDAIVGALDVVVRGLRAAQRGVRKFF